MTLKEFVVLRNIYLRVDEETKKVLDECVKETNSTRSEVVRKGIYLVRDDLKK